MVGTILPTYNSRMRPTAVRLSRTSPGAALPRVGVVGSQLPAREFADPCPDGSSSVIVAPPVQLTVGGLLAVYGRISRPPGTPLGSQVYATAVGVTTSETGWCRGPHGRLETLDLAATRGVAGLWAVVSRPNQHNGAIAGTLVNLYTAAEVAVVTAFHRARPHPGSRNDRFVPFTGAPFPGMSDGLYVLDRVTGVIEAIVPARTGRPDFIHTGLVLMSDNGKTVVFSALEVSATGAPGPQTIFVATLDGDADGQFDAWELTYGLNPSSPADASLDADGDGLTNSAEFAAGTHPMGSGVRHFAEGAQRWFLR